MPDLPAPDQPSANDLMSPTEHRPSEAAPVDAVREVPWAAERRDEPQEAAPRETGNGQDSAGAARPASAPGDGADPVPTLHGAGQ